MRLALGNCMVKVGVSLPAYVPVVFYASINSILGSRQVGRVLGRVILKYAGYNFITAGWVSIQQQHKQRFVGSSPARSTCLLNSL